MKLKLCTLIRLKKYNPISKEIYAANNLISIFTLDTLNGLDANYIIWKNFSRILTHKMKLIKTL
jgi:hypothetical protein